MIVATVWGFISTSASLGIIDASWSCQGTLSPSKDSHAKHRVSIPPVRGRADSAEAEELLAGMGFNVGGSRPYAKRDTPGRRRKQHRTRPRQVGAREGKQPSPVPTQESADASAAVVRDGASGPVENQAPRRSGGEGSMGFLEAHDFVVPAEDMLSFERRGHAVTRGLFSVSQLDVLRSSVVAGFEHREIQALRQKVAVWFGDETASSLRTVAELRARLKRIAPDDIPFLQVFNMFRGDGPHQGAIEKLVLSPRLAHVAAQLLGCSRIRVYQDSTFVKRPGDGPTRWHSDLHMAPLDCNDFVTAWIPLSPVPPRRDGGTPLVFADRSHRDFALNHWQDPKWIKDLTGRYTRTDHAPLAAGDVTWHHGWTLHSSPGNAGRETRVAIAISYMRDGTRLLASDTKRVPDPEDSWSYGDWIGDLRPGAIVKHPSVPLVWNGGKPLESGS